MPIRTADSECNVVDLEVTDRKWNRMSTSRSGLAQELCELQFASGWSHGVVTELAAISEYVDFGTGTTIFQQGETNHTLFLLCSGRVGLDMFIPARGTVRVLTLMRGELLAWSTLVGNGHMTATATALEPVRAIAVDGSQLMALCDKRHDIGYPVMQRLAWALAHRLTGTRLQLLDLYVHTTPHIMRPTDGGP